MPLNRLWNNLTDMRKPVSKMASTHQAEPSAYVNRTPDTQAYNYVKAVGEKRVEGNNRALSMAGCK